MNKSVLLAIFCVPIFGLLFYTTLVYKVIVAIISAITFPLIDLMLIFDIFYSPNQPRVFDVRLFGIGSVSRGWAWLIISDYLGIEDE